MENTIKLTSNEEKVRKKLEKFPQGVKAVALKRELPISKTSLYENLNGLEMKGSAFRGKHSLWYPAPPSKNEDVLPKKRFGFFEWLDRRAERKRLEREKELEEIDHEIRRLQARSRLTDMKKEYERTHFIKDDESIPLDVVAEMEKKVREQFGLSATDPI